jgi:hypothetical protein
MLNIEAAAGLLRPSRSGTGFVPPSFHRHMGEAGGQEASPVSRFRKGQNAIGPRLAHRDADLPWRGPMAIRPIVMQDCRRPQNREP